MAEETPFLNFYGGEFDPESGRFRDPSGKFVPTPPKEESENVGEKAKSEKDKKKVLKKYLQDHGFVFTDEMINEAMTHGKNRIKRKVGKKPVKMRRARLK